MQSLHAKCCASFLSSKTSNWLHASKLILIASGCTTNGLSAFKSDIVRCSDSNPCTKCFYNWYKNVYECHDTGTGSKYSRIAVLSFDAILSYLFVYTAAWHTKTGQATLKPKCNGNSSIWKAIQTYSNWQSISLFTARLLQWMVCRSSSWTTLARSEMDMHQCWTATQPTLPASSQRSPPRSIAVQERSLRLPPSSSRTEMLHMSRWCQASPCAWRLSHPTHPWDVSPSVTWGRQSQSESSRSVLILHKPFLLYLNCHDAAIDPLDHANPESYDSYAKPPRFAVTTAELCSARATTGNSFNQFNAQQCQSPHSKEIVELHYQSQASSVSLCMLFISVVPLHLLASYYCPCWPVITALSLSLVANC